MFVVVAHNTHRRGSITACVLPFIPTAIIKAVRHHVIGLNLRKRIPGLSAGIILRPHHLLCAGLFRQRLRQRFRRPRPMWCISCRMFPAPPSPHLLHRHPLFPLPQQAGDWPLRHAGKGQALRCKDGEYFGLEEKDYVYQDLIREIDAKATPEILADICRDCCWFPISACCKNICEGRYVK